jgi:hypothetical protein
MNKESTEEKKKSLLKSKRPRLPLNLKDLTGLINEDFPPLTQDKVRRRRSLSRSRSLPPSTNTWTRPPQVSDLEAFSSPVRSSTPSHLESLSRPTSKFCYRPSKPSVAAVLNTLETNASANLPYNAY